ncbi:SDR family NAD(P)-dependent oxidoreductase [Pedobacter sp. Leaf176]|uniref:SDR family NAD(P)-dependent oxidoreductase n=1 Tax=Pedobacter sp. Leaf176 TaxID=1736286 RepID=UPI0006F50C6D|nr:SDR family NAD(P)-dependent oxidoreductase [Pedobacter sp. Leaf176]KQR70506.1 oxidoreductase [Pedobacter sp. Leaf176]
MKKVIIIGATSGIGKSLALQMADAGYIVGITGKRQILINEIEGLNAGKILGSCFDVNDETNLIENLISLIERLGGYDILIYSAGYGEINESLNTQIEQDTINTNVRSFTNVVTWSFDYFKRQGRGQIAAVTSVAGLRGNDKSPAYSASKAFQINYLEGLARKSSKLKLGIDILDIRPGYVDTAMAKGDNLFWVTPVEKAAKQIIRGIERKADVIYISKRWRLFAWTSKILPRSLVKKI